MNSEKIFLAKGVCAGPAEESMGYTIQAMKKPLVDLQIKVIKEICYYNSMKVPVKDNIDFQRELVDIGIKFGNIILNDEK